MPWTPEFVRDDDRSDDDPVRLAVRANLTGWETVIFQVVDGPDGPEEPEVPDSDSATAAFAP